MRILLVEPSDRSVLGLNFNGLFVMEPMVLELLAAAVPEHEVEIVDLRLDPLPIEYYLHDFRPDVVGVTGVTALHNEMNYVLGQSKRAGAFTVAGGPHASFAYRALDNIDAAVVGEGEKAFRELILALSSNSALSSVPNLVWRNDGKWTENLTTTDTLWPLPRRCLARDYKYTAFGQAVAMVEATRGCPHRCSFCVTPKLFRGKYKTRPVEEIVDYISTRPEPIIMFPDPDFMASPKYVVSLLNEIRKARLKKKYSVAIRADEVVSNRDIIEEWSRSGLSFAFIGFEGYRQEQLDSYKKDSPIDDNSKAVSILHRYNVISIGTMIVSPGWSHTEFEECLDYVKGLRSDIPLFSVLTPFPGTSISNDCQVIAGFDKFDVLHAVTNTTLPYKQFQMNFARISKAVFSGKGMVRLLGKLWRRRLLNMGGLASMSKIWNYINTIDKAIVGEVNDELGRKLP